MEQLTYWDTVGATKTFTHPLEVAWLDGVPRDARILDYGCGYGRTMAELSDLGFRNVSGVDLSPALIDRGRRARPDLTFAVIESPPATGHATASVDVILLFAVLTCIPRDEDQVALIAELRRVLAPGGLLYVSDLLLQPDERNRRRYAEHAGRTGAPHGVFDTGDGAVCRHHDPDRLRGLLGAFDLRAERRVEVATMNGNRAQALQLLARAA